MTKRALVLFILLGALTIYAAGPLTAARPPESKCDDGRDNDGDGLIDMADPDCADGGGGSGGGGTGAGDLFTCDHIRSDGTDAIFGDGEGSNDPNEYCHSESQVESFVGSGGAHVLDTEKSGRVIGLDFSDCRLVDGCTLPPNFTGVTEVVISTENSGYSGVDLQAMAPGENAEVGLIIGFDIGRKNHARLTFGRETSATYCLDDDFGDTVTVTRGEEPAENVWTFESDSTQEACLSEVQNNKWNEPVYHGHFSMPFQITVAVEP